MDKFLDALIATLEPLKTGESEDMGINYIGRMSEAEQFTMLKPGLLPAIVVTGTDERDEPGPFGGTSTRVFTARVRIFKRNVADLDQDRSSSNLDNLYAISDAIRELIRKSPTLGLPSTEYWRLQLDAGSTGFDFPIAPDWGIYNIRDLSVSLSRLEQWDGGRNPVSALIA